MLSIHQIVFTKIFSFLAIKSIQKSLPDQGEPLWAEDSRKISHSYHSYCQLLPVTASYCQLLPATASSRIYRRALAIKIHL